MYVQLEEEQVTEITRQGILKLLEDLEVVGGEEDISLWDSLNEVLSYISTRDQLEEYESREINPEFLKLLVKDSLLKMFMR